MFDLIARPTMQQTPGHPPAQAAREAAAGYRGPERRRAASPASEARLQLLAAMLDEIDYGMLLVAEDGHALHVNHVAHAELDELHPLQLLGHTLRARASRDVAPLFDALAGACGRGLRRMVALGEGAQRVTVAVVPLARAGAAGAPADLVAALVMLGKRQVCEDLSVEGFARSMNLTPAETAVLKALCRGERPNRIAERHGVKLATVRTQIGSVRAKTGAENIGALVRQVAVLPPMVCALRNSAAPAWAA